MKNDVKIWSRTRSKSQRNLFLKAGVCFDGVDLHERQLRVQVPTEGVVVSDVSVQAVQVSWRRRKLRMEWG